MSKDSHCNEQTHEALAPQVCLQMQTVLMQAYLGLLVNDMLIYAMLSDLTDCKLFANCLLPSTGPRGPQGAPGADGKPGPPGKATPIEIEEGLKLVKEHC